MECVSRTVQYGLGYVLGICKCLQVFYVVRKSVCNRVACKPQDKLDCQ